MAASYVAAAFSCGFVVYPEACGYKPAPTCLHHSFVNAHPS